MAGECAVCGRSGELLVLCFCGVLLCMACLMEHGACPDDPRTDEADGDEPADDSAR